MGIPASSDMRPGDGDIWHLLKNGGREAVSLLVYRYYDDLLRYGCSFCANTVVVEDMIQDLFCELCQKSDGLSQIRAIKPYLFVSLRRRIFRQMKQERKWYQVDVDGEVEFSFDVEFSPEELIVKKEQREALCRQMSDYMRQLTPRQREALYLRFYENLTYDAIAEVMEITVPYLYLLIHKSIGRIRKMARKI